MFARKLGRLAGLVFVLAVVFGGAAGAVESNAEHDATVSAVDFDAAQMNILGEIVWD